MLEPREFRQCPFEKKGIEDGTIIEVALSERREERLPAMVAAFIQLRNRPESPAIRFTLPKSAYASCSSNRELRYLLLPFQADMIAADLDTRLRPFIPYQHTNWAREWGTGIVKSDHARFVQTLALMNFLKKTGLPMPRSIAEQANWIEGLFIASKKHLIPDVHLKITGEAADKSEVHMMSIRSGGLTLLSDYAGPDHPERNRTCFSIVKTPYYPNTFPRYSENVEIVVSREADFVALPKPLRKRIRTQSNEMYLAHGIEITDLENFKPPIGLWVLDEK
ncbi:MAG: hypothetical protein JWM46_933 [Candidatus Kaiserbacteria bacterium]|nr:hypothetical protein [Candidatus Kaiserbacteria bacterium]